MDDNTVPECIRTLAATYGCKILQLFRTVLYEYEENEYGYEANCEGYPKNTSLCNIFLFVKIRQLVVSRIRIRSPATCESALTL